MDFHTLVSLPPSQAAIIIHSCRLSWHFPSTALLEQIWGRNDCQSLKSPSAKEHKSINDTSHGQRAFFSPLFFPIVSGLSDTMKQGARWPTKCTEILVCVAHILMWATHVIPQIAYIKVYLLVNVFHCILNGGIWCKKKSWLIWINVLSGEFKWIQQYGNPGKALQRAKKKLHNLKKDGWLVIKICTRWLFPLESSWLNRTVNNKAVIFQREIWK